MEEFGVTLVKKADFKEETLENEVLGANKMLR